MSRSIACVSSTYAIARIPSASGALSISVTAPDALRSMWSASFSTSPARVSGGPRKGNSATLPTYAAITARSHHTQLVNAAMMDGSVRAVRETIALATWRALSTRQGGEVVSGDEF